MSQNHTKQPLQQLLMRETDAAAVHIVPHASLAPPVASAANGLFSAVTDLVSGHGFGRKRSRSDSATTGGVVMTTGPADASAPLSQPAIKRYHTAPATLNSTATGPTSAAHPRCSTSVATGVGASPVAGAVAPTTPVPKQDQLVATRKDQHRLPVIRTASAAATATRPSDVVMTPTTPEAKAAAGLLQLAAAPMSTGPLKGFTADLCKVAAASGLPKAGVGVVTSSQDVGKATWPASTLTLADLRPNDRIRVQIPSPYTKQDGTKSKSSWYHLFDATVESIDVESGMVSLGHVTVSVESNGTNDPLVLAHCKSIASTERRLRWEVGLVNRAGAWEPL